MKVVYVAGPYSAPSEAEVKRNIARAEDVAQQIWKKGHVAICPHLNTAHWGSMLTHEQFIKGDLELIRRCDAVFMLAGWPASKGASQEREFAEAHGIDVFFTRSELFAWADKADEPATPPYAEDIEAAQQPDWTPAKLDALVEKIRTEPLTDFLAERHADAAFITKDSGKRHVEITGALRDTNEGKGRFDLIPALPLKRLAQLYQRGAAKYGDNNWRKGINLPRYIDSAMRHINDFQAGERAEDHLIAAAWNLFSYVWTEAEIAAGRLPGSLEEGKAS